MAYFIAACGRGLMVDTYLAKDKISWTSERDDGFQTDDWMEIEVLFRNIQLQLEQYELGGPLVTPSALLQSGFPSGKGTLTIVAWKIRMVHTRTVNLKKRLTKKERRYVAQKDLG